MVVKFLFIVLLVNTICNFAMAQDKPSPTDSPNYKEAYELVCYAPERFRKAEQLLLGNGTRKLSELNANELLIICTCYNELGERGKQLAAAEELWTRFPENPKTTGWYVNSKLNTLETDGDCRRAIELVDTAITAKKGIRSQLLVLKAEAVLRNSSIPDARKRVEVSDLLIEAYVAHEEIPGSEEVGDLRTTDIIDLNEGFSLFFSTAERESLKVRMENARETKNKKKNAKG
ncbi:MAG: hypothetical protein ACOYKN_19980 [Pirellula sp.]